MSKPTNDELKIAMTTAATMKQNDDKPVFIAKSLLNYNYRLPF